jgi:amino acid transporter
VSNWTPFAPNGFKEIVVGATVVFFAYVGFDAVANSAEECRKPKVLQMHAFANHFCVLLYNWIVFAMKDHIVSSDKHV